MAVPVKLMNAEGFMMWPELDYILVPIGLIFMAGYHLWLLLYIVRFPTKTIVGINSINRVIWVQTMMEDPAKNGVLAVQTLRNNIMASTLMASTSIMLSSIIAVLISKGDVGCGRSDEPSLLLGDTSANMLSVKFFFIMLCFLVSFLLNAQSVRYYSHASILINVPVRYHWQRLSSPEYVSSAVNRGSYCWSLGLRAFYFSVPLFIWLFGPIPMITCCLLLVVILYFLDFYFYWSEGEGERRLEEEEMRCEADSL